MPARRWLLLVAVAFVLPALLAVAQLPDPTPSDTCYPGDPN